MASVPPPYPRQFQSCLRTLMAKRSLPPHAGQGPISSAPTGFSLIPRAQLMQTAKSESVKLNAAEAILSRGWGRSVQAFQIDSHFAAKKLNELTENELTQFEARLASAEPQIDEQMM